MHNMYSTAYINVCFCVVFSLSSIYCLFFFLSFSYSTLLLVFAYSTIEINYRNRFYFLLRFPSLFLSVLKWTENFRADFNIKGVALRLPIPIYWISEEEQQVNFGSRKKKGISRRVEKNITSFRHQRHEESKTYAQRLLNIENVCCHCLIKGMCRAVPRTKNHCLYKKGRWKDDEFAKERRKSFSSFRIWNWFWTKLQSRGKRKFDL